jgi:hypothetical protein
MSNDDTASELQRLRAEMAALKEAQREPETAAPPPGPSEKVNLPEKPIAEAAAPAPADEAEAGEEEVKSQLDELAALLEHEIRDLPTITCLAVFSLGILMGRLLR